VRGAALPAAHSGGARKGVADDAATTSGPVTDTGQLVMLGLILARVLAVLRTLVMAAVLVRRSAVMVREGCRRHSCQDDCRRGRYDCALEFHVASPSFIQFVDSDANGHHTGEPWLHPVGDCARAHRPSWGSSRRKGVRAASQDARPSTSAAACSMGRACGRCGIAGMRGGGRCRATPTPLWSRPPTSAQVNMQWCRFTAVNIGNRAHTASSLFTFGVAGVRCDPRGKSDWSRIP